jgi:hypothetical protein
MRTIDSIHSLSAISKGREVPVSSDRDLLLEIHRQIEEHLGIGQYEPTTALGSGRKNATILRPVSNGLPEGSPPETEEENKRRLNRLARLAGSQGSGEGQTDRPEDSSTPEE